MVRTGFSSPLLSAAGREVARRQLVTAWRTIVVEPLVSHYPLRQSAEGEAAVDADLVQEPFPGLVGRPGRGVLGPCLVRVLAPPRHWGRPGTRVGRDGLVTIVGELVVFPGSDKGKLLV